jgi:hypothetical protein
MTDANRLAATSEIGNRHQKAKEKRALAEQVRDIASSLSLVRDKEVFLRHANELEEEAVRLEGS